eukprot:TRINITY_DN10237_c0_g1_i2.p1 TRINITY_DN10237_c0_g1~~TRINITY_DN10237_c0_g1_i2.p1  ORF type:complete len:647 (+),score=149.36 TRINITY_DN10237_c0_g1_i2:58-1941(+)
MNSLFTAALEGNADEMRNTMKTFPGIVNVTRQSDGATALILSAQAGNIECVQYLVAEDNVDLNALSHDGTTAIHAAVRSGHLQVLKCLLQHGADPARSMQDGTTPLHTAALTGNTQATRTLVDHGVPVNIQKRTGITPAYAAAYNGHVPALQYLVENGAADLKLATVNATSPLHAAAYNGHLQAVRFLVKAGASLTDARDDGSTALYLAALNGHLPVVRFLFDSHHGLPPHSDLALYIAAYNGFCSVVQFLVDRHVVNDTPSRNGMTPLYAATFNGHLDVVECLVRAGASVEKVTPNGTAPVHAAAYNGHLDLVKYLVEVACCNKDKSRDDGSTALFAAAVSGHLEVVRYLCSAGCDTNKARSDGSTPLFAAAHTGHLEVLRYLAEVCDCNCSKSRRGGVTPLQTAAMCGHVEIVEYLIARGVSESDEGVRLAAQYGRLSVVRFLMRRATALDNFTASQLHASALATATAFSQMEVTQWLQASAGWTPLHYASEDRDVELAARLLHQGADPHVCDSQNLTPLDIAQRVFSKPLCTRTIECLGAASLPWTPETNRFFPPGFRRAVKIFVRMISRWDVEANPPYEVWCIVLSFLPRNWDLRRRLTACRRKGVWRTVVDVTQRRLRGRVA